MKNLLKILILLFTIGCSSEDSVTLNPVEMELSSAIKKWNNSNINSYSYILTVSCYCLDTEPNKIEVIDNKITKVNGESVTLDQLQNEYWDVKTFDELFNIIDEKLKDDPFIFTLKFDQTYGFPIDIYFDMDDMIADEEIGYTTSDFKII
tara:strand:- start:332 stop:781 length:450 start_codon:yes stop_codon:yes gene_type:complete